MEILLCSIKPSVNVYLPAAHDSYKYDGKRKRKNLIFLHKGVEIQSKL